MAPIAARPVRGLRTDVPGYRVHQEGRIDEVADLLGVWRGARGVSISRVGAGGRSP